MSDAHTARGTLRADTAAIRRVADDLAGLSGHAEAAAASVDSAAAFDLRRVFGCVGDEFATDFGAARGRHHEALASLARLISDVAGAAHATADAYVDAENRTADALAALR